MKDRVLKFLTAPDLLRCMAGYVYFHFGILKFFPDLCPAELISEQSILRMTMGLIEVTTAYKILAVVECLIGLGMLFKFKMRWVFPFFVGHIVFTFAPLVLFPELTFKFFPFAPTLEGMYIIKNVTMFAAAWIVQFPMAFGKPIEAQT